MMKVALIHYRLILRGGLETRLQNYVNFFCDRGDDVTVICAKKSQDINLPEGVNLVKLDPGIVPKVFRTWYFNKRLKKFMEQNKFDFSLSLGRTSHQDAILAPANHIGYMKAMAKKSASLSDRMQILLDRESFNNSKIIYAASKMMKDQLVDFYNIDPEKIKILYPPLDIHKFNAKSKGNQRQLKEKFGMSKDKMTFVFVSTSHHRKGFPLLKKVFENLNPGKYELFVAGYPKIGSSKNIQFTEFLKNPNEFFAAADFSLLPAYFEPFGQVVTESLACGTPVLVSSMVGGKEIISNGTGIVVDSFDLKDWIKAIEQLSQKQFYIPEDFVKTYKLSTEDHMKMMLDEWGKIA